MRHCTVRSHKPCSLRKCPPGQGRTDWSAGCRGSAVGHLAAAEGTDEGDLSAVRAAACRCRNDADSRMTLLLVIVIGVAAGVASGMLGVGGGILFVPALALVAGLAQVEAEATSLAAMIPVVLVGTYSQHRYGNVRLVEGLIIGGLSIPGVIAGAVLANSVSSHTLEIAFGCLMFVIAGLLVMRTLRGSDSGDGQPHKTPLAQNSS